MSSGIRVWKATQTTLEFDLAIHLIAANRLRLMMNNPAIRWTVLVWIGWLTLIFARSDDGIDHGYFDGRLWRISSSSSAQMRVAVAEGPQVFVSGRDLGRQEASLVRWDGIRWETLAVAGSFPHLLGVGKQLIVAGNFTRIRYGILSKEQLVATNIARWDLGTWHPVGSGIQGTVQCLAAGNGKVYVGGQLMSAGSLPLTNVASWDLVSSQWSSLGGGLPSPVRLLEETPEGLFAVYPGDGADVLSRWNGQEWETIASIRGSNPTEVVPVSDLIWHEGSLVLAGSFNQIEGQPVAKVARRRSGNWENVGENLNGQPRSLAIAAGDLFVSGSLLIQNGGEVAGAGPVARWRGQQWEIADLGPGAVEAERMVGRGRELFAVGRLLEKAPIGSSQYPVIWQFDGDRWSPMNGGLGEIVGARRLARHGDGVVVRLNDSRPPVLYDGVRFSLTSNSPAFNFSGTWTLGSDGKTAHAVAAVTESSSNHVVLRLEGQEWKLAADPLPVQAAALAFGEGALFAAGRFSPPTGTNSVVWAWNGQHWRQLGGQFQNVAEGADGGVIASLAWMDGSLYAGGSFTHHNGAPLTNLARWNGSVWEQIGALNGPVTAMTAARGVLHMVGRFFGVAAVTNSSYAQWNGREWSTLGTGLYGMAPQAVSVSDSGLVMACGDPQSRQSIIRLLIWRGEAWITPEKGTSLFDGTF